jgi:hypothetical protein
MGNGKPGLLEGLHDAGLRAYGVKEKCRPSSLRRKRRNPSSNMQAFELFFCASGSKACIPEFSPLFSPDH